MIMDMATATHIVQELNSILWGPYCLIPLLVGTGIYFTFKLRFVQIRLFFAAIRQVFAEKPAEFDPRKYLGPARDNMKKLYIHKIVNVLGSNGKAE